MIINLDSKLIGLESVTREDLFELVNSWGRTKHFLTTNDGFNINDCNKKECYPLENLDVSKIKDFSEIFRASLYNGDLSKWNVSNAISLAKMFAFSKFNNNSLNSWDVSNVSMMQFMFFNSEFNGDISSWKTNKLFNVESMFAKGMFDGDVSKWNLNNITQYYRMFSMNENFEKKYNNGEPLPINSNEMYRWIKANIDKIKSMNTTKEEILEFFSFDSNLTKEINHNNKGLL